MSAQCASSTRARSATNSTSWCGGPGMFQMSACSATSRSSGVPQPPISRGGPGPLHRLGLVPACPAAGNNVPRSRRGRPRPHPPQDLDRLAEPGHPLARRDEGESRTPRTRRRPDSRRRSRPCRAAGGSPTPMPMTSRPPEIASTVEAVSPEDSRGRMRLLVTSRSRSVCAARALSSVQPSWTWPSLGPRSDKMVPEPGVLDLGQGVGLLPDAAEVVVGDVHGGGLDTEAHAVIAHIAQLRQSSAQLTDASGYSFRHDR